MKIIITGAAVFIGSSLTKTLLNDGDSIILLEKIIENQ